MVEEAGISPANRDECEVSVVMPCLNEEETIGQCIQKAQQAFREHNLRGEVVVCDNGSQDRSVEIARELGAHVVFENKKGYGSAYLRGIREARGRYVIMGDSDNTYDFSDILPFIEPLRQGYDMVMGSRLRGTILPGAMPWLHRYIGNPFLSWFLNVLYKTGVSDSHCGMRAFTRDAFEKMKLVTPGMEYASEMVIKASRAGLKITEVPITYYPRKGRSKLKSLNDGWRHMRFMLMYSPTHLFLVPGFLVLLVGLMLVIALYPGPIWTPWHKFDIHFMVLGSVLAILGYQIINLGLFAKAISFTRDFVVRDLFIERFYQTFTLEKGIYLGLSLVLIGLILNGVVLYSWIKAHFGPLQKMREALLGMTFLVLGVQTIFSSFLLSMVRIKKEE
jgi:glycosyltransferase involved in cell wall biosynthesis